MNSLSKLYRGLVQLVDMHCLVRAAMMFQCCLRERYFVLDLGVIENAVFLLLTSKHQTNNFGYIADTLLRVQTILCPIVFVLDHFLDKLDSLKMSQ
jgi:hypothetical protein